MKKRFWNPGRARAAAAFLVIWLACVVFLAATGGNFLFPVSSMVLFGAVLTGAALLITRKADAPPVPVAHPRTESLALLGYLLVYTFVLFGPISGMVKNAFAPGPVQEVVVLLYKLVVHLGIPVLLVRTVHGHLRGIFDAGLGRSGTLPALVVFPAVMIVAVGLLNSIFQELGAGGRTPASVAGWIVASWAWLILEVGVPEEFLFRGLIQSRLTAWSGSAPAAIVATAVIFALVHVPSLYLRGGDAVARQASSLPQVIALAVGGLAPIALLFGVLWHRTRSFLLVVVVHGAIDAMPHVREMIALWS